MDTITASNPVVPVVNTPSVQPPVEDSVTQDPNDNGSNELEHITQEMYKKNFELADKNKTLAILRKIDGIILSTVTDVNQIAKQVADTVVTDAELKAVVVLLYDHENDMFVRLASSSSPEIQAMLSEPQKNLFPEKEPVSVHHVLSESINQRVVRISKNLIDVLCPFLPVDTVEKIQMQAGIKSVLVYPLIIRGETIGSIVLCIGEEEDKLFQDEKDLIIRVVDTVGIALDNALLYKKIQDANVKLQELDKLKDEFVSLASHELRTPMTVIKSYLWMVLQGKVQAGSEKEKQYLERVYKSTEDLISLVNGMLNVSRIEAGKIIVEPKPTDIVAWTKEFAEDLGPRSQETGISVSVLEPNAPIPQVMVDGAKIREVFTNIVGNSFKFTPKGGNVTISFVQNNNMVEVHIKDTGKGIDKEDMPKLFQKFGQTGKDVLTRPLAQGTGLGLYITKAIVELHNGKIWVESEGEGKGTTFSFSVKIATPEEIEKSKQSSQSVSPLSPSATLQPSSV